MADKQGLFKTSVVRKNVMAVTGLFIAFFLVIHLAGNLILILPVDNPHDMYNDYSHFLVHFWPISVVAYILYATLAIHAIDALMLTIGNRKAKGEKYAVTDNSTSNWYSRNMGILGSIIGIFIIIHMGQFWWNYKVIGHGEPDLYNMVVETFQNGVWLIVYEIGIIVLGFHLVHGIESAHKSLGLYPKSVMKVVKYIALGFGILVAFLYAIIPIIIFLNK